MLRCSDDAGLSGPTASRKSSIATQPLDTATNKASQVGIKRIFSFGDGITFTGMPSRLTLSHSFFNSLQNITGSFVCCSQRAWQADANVMVLLDSQSRAAAHNITCC